MNNSSIIDGLYHNIDNDILFALAWGPHYCPSEYFTHPDLICENGDIFTRYRAEYKKIDRILDIACHSHTAAKLAYILGRQKDYLAYGAGRTFGQLHRDAQAFDAIIQVKKAALASLLTKIKNWMALRIAENSGESYALDFEAS